MDSLSSISLMTYRKARLAQPTFGEY